MHGRKKGSVKATPQAKIASYQKLKTVILAKHAAKVYNPTMLGLNHKLIALNPDFYTLWNYERLLVTALKPNTPDILAGELKLVETALMRNPKCYYAWHHRQWIISHEGSDFTVELSLCDRMLNLDARNFHGWNYRRWLVRHAVERQVTTWQKELAFTLTKIQQDFSNYSAWHHRCHIIHILHDLKLLGGGKEEDNLSSILDEEFALVKNAFFVDPYDQSAWLYHRWLLSCVVASDNTLAVPKLGISLGVSTLNVSLKPHRREEKSEKENGQEEEDKQEEEEEAHSSTFKQKQRQLYVFSREITMLEELRQLAPTCKWILLTWCLLVAGRTSFLPSEAQEDEMKQVSLVMSELMSLDPMRKQYYTDVLTHLQQS